MSGQGHVDREFWRVVSALRWVHAGADDDAVENAHDGVLVKATRAGATVGVVLAVAVAVTLVLAGRPWWTVVAFLVYGGPIAVLLWMSLTVRVVDKWSSTRSGARTDDGRSRRPSVAVGGSGRQIDEVVEPR